MGMSEDKFAAFSRRDLIYSSIKGHDLHATVLTPKISETQFNQPHPVVVHWHGGGFVTGHRMYGPWWSRWILELALTHDAIIVSPDYRLLPESSGDDVLDDVVYFWQWFADKLPSVARNENWHGMPDFTRVMTCGSSSGGFLAVQSGLLAPVKCSIQAIISISAPFYMDDSGQGLVPMPRMILGAWPPPPREAERHIREYIRTMKPGVLRSESDPAEVWDLLLSIIRESFVRFFFYERPHTTCKEALAAHRYAEQAWMPRLLDVKNNERLDVIKLLGTRDTMPPLWIIHGEGDSLVPIVWSKTFINAMQKTLPHVPVHVTIRPGDHGFEMDLGLEEGWVKDGSRFIEQFWP